MFHPLLRTLRAALLLLAAAVAVAWTLTGYRQWDQQRKRAQLATQLAALPKPQPNAPYPRHFFQRGVSFVRDGRDAYHPEPTSRFFAELREYGIDSVAAIPYGWIRLAEGQVRVGREGDEADLYVGLTGIAHAQNMRVLLKPQLWVIPGGYPGAIRIEDPVKRQQFLASYRTFILHWARIATLAHADLFAVGTELEHFSADASFWRELIREIRTVYPGPLVYAANQGKDFEQITWWDALDYIGLNEYYPLPPTLDFTAILTRLEQTHQRYQRPVLLTEAGFASVAGAEREPWAEPDRPVDLAHQARCYEALLNALWAKPWFHGVYWWKIGADRRGGPQDNSLTPWGKPAMEVIRRYYRSKSR
jgi:hypothetical protein